MKLTHKRLSQLLSYDPKTGIFRWRVRASNRIHVGDVAGNLNKIIGYQQIRIDGVLYYAHCLAWFVATKTWPLEIDHRNGVRDDNRKKNLRVSTHQQNTWNQTQLSTKNTSGNTGVSPRRGKWRATITKDGKQIHLGDFIDKTDAISARRTAELKHFENFAKETVCLVASI